jgi:NADP-dependent 3-hydroxy acid dehydrogenase YdfG
MSKETVLVTGASSGIGKATAKTLIGKGYAVYGAARRLEKMDDLKELGGLPLKMDITKEDEVVAVIEQIGQERGGVDILINNAGCALYGAVEETTMEYARYQFEVNFFGVARLTQLVLP